MSISNVPQQASSASKSISGTSLSRLENLPNDLLLERIYTLIPGFVAKAPQVSRFFCSIHKTHLSLCLKSIFDICIRGPLLCNFILQSFAPWADPACTRNPHEAFLALQDKVTGIPCPKIPTPEEVRHCSQEFERTQNAALRLVWGSILEKLPQPPAPGTPGPWEEAGVIRDWILLHPNALDHITRLDLDHLSDRVLKSAWTHAYPQLSLFLAIPDQNASVERIHDWMGFHAAELERLCELNEDNPILTEEEYGLLHSDHATHTPAELVLKLTIIRDLNPGQVLESPLLPPALHADVQELRQWIAVHPGVLERFLHLGLGQLTLECLPQEMALFTGLKMLHLGGNALRALPPADVFDRLLQLEHLNLSGNQLETLDPRVLDHCNALQSLNLSHNRIGAVDLRGFARFDTLQSLNLSDNPLHTMALGFPGSLPRLRLLSLSKNQAIGERLPTPLFYDLLDRCPGLEQCRLSDGTHAHMATIRCLGSSLELEDRNTLEVTSLPRTRTSSPWTRIWSGFKF